MTDDVGPQDIPEAIRVEGAKVFAGDLFDRWLMGSEPLLGGRRPIDVIHAGEVDAVVDALIAIGSGGHA